MKGRGNKSTYLPLNPQDIARALRYSKCTGSIGRKKGRTKRRKKGKKRGERRREGGRREGGNKERKILKCRREGWVLNMWIIDNRFQS